MMSTLPRSFMNCILWEQKTISSRRSIELATPEIVSVYSKQQTTAKITWTTAEGAQGYEMFRSEDPDAAEELWTLTKTIRDRIRSSIQTQDSHRGKTYYYKVRAFAVNDDDSKVYSAFSEVNYMPAAVQFDNPYSNSSSRIRIRWEQVEGAHGYQIWRQEDDGSFRIVKIIGAREEEQALGQCEETAYSNTGLGSRKRIRLSDACIHVPGGNVVYGAYSDVFLLL